MPEYTSACPLCILLNLIYITKYIYQIQLGYYIRSQEYDIREDVCNTVTRYARP